MANVFVERRQLSEGVALTWDMAHHLYMRQDCWPVIIVSEHPQVTLAALRKQWIKVVAKLRKEYSATLNQRRKDRLLSVIAHMESLPFTLKPDEALGEAVYLMTPVVAQSHAALTCRTIYTANPITPEFEQYLMDKLEHYGLLVEYGMD